MKRQINPTRSDPRIELDPGATGTETASIRHTEHMQHVVQNTRVLQATVVSANNEVPPPNHDTRRANLKHTNLEHPPQRVCHAAAERRVFDQLGSGSALVRSLARWRLTLNSYPPLASGIIRSPEKLSSFLRRRARSVAFTCFGRRSLVVVVTNLGPIAHVILLSCEDAASAAARPITARGSPRSEPHANGDVTGPKRGKTAPMPRRRAAVV